MQMQSPGSKKDVEKKNKTGIPGPASAADMIYALMSRFFDKVLNL